MIKWLYHEQSNTMAIADCSGGIPLISICCDDYTGINPFYPYPLNWVNSYYGWVVIGDL